MKLVKLFFVHRYISLFGIDIYNEIKKNKEELKLSEQNVYQRNGYANRKEYLQSLADDYGVPLQTVYAIAEMYGESEDFDGLISSLEDAEDMEWD